MGCRQEQRYVSGSCAITSPVISPTVAIFGCEFARKENRVEPENGEDVK
jgi:hypothetical protein